METARGRQAVGQPPQLPGVCGGERKQRQALVGQAVPDAMLVNQYRAPVRFQVLL